MWACRFDDKNEPRWRPDGGLDGSMPRGGMKKSVELFLSMKYSPGACVQAASAVSNRHAAEKVTVAAQWVSSGAYI